MGCQQLVPRFILEQFTARRNQGFFQGVTLFIDLAGFSALSDRLIPYGRTGIEALTQVINRIFDPIITEIYSRGGFISTFAGDAFTAIFSQGTPQTIDQALAAASWIQTFVAAHQPLATRLGDVSLAVKIGLDEGEIEWGILGKTPQYTYYFRGPAIEGAAQAEDAAAPGDIILSQNLKRQIPHGLSLQLVKGGYRLLSPPSPPRRSPYQTKRPTWEHLAPFVPQALKYRSVQAEFRNLCSIFIAFQAPQTYNALHEFVTRVMDLAQIYGGYFNKVDFGDKGSVMLILFGAPIAHENPVERAAGFLWALRNDHSGGIPWRAGMTFGTAYAGFVGGKLRCEYTAIGDVVNLSSRLMSMAPWGDIWVDAAVKNALEPRYQFTDLGQRAVKGKAHPISIFRLESKSSPEIWTRKTTALVGREKPLASLEQWLEPLWHEDAHTRRPVLIHIQGEPGIGKTRLVHELRQRLSSRHPYQWFYAPADAILKQPWNPFIYGLKHIFQQSPDAPLNLRRQTFDRIFGELVASLPPDQPQAQQIRTELERTRSILAALLDIRWEGSLYERLDPKLRFENTLLALINFFKALSIQQPLIIEIDGGHLLDPASQTLMEQLAEALAAWPIGILVLSRQETKSDPSAPLPWMHKGLWRTLTLSPLDENATRRMAAHILQGELTPQAARFLYEKTGGNPLFIEHLVQDLKQRNAFHPAGANDHRFDLNISDLPDVPTTIEAMLMARLDRLEAPVRQIVQTASVLGREFDLPILAAMLNHLADLLSLVKIAEAEHIWQGTTATHYVFIQALMRDVAYRMQLGERLRELHRRAGEAYEAIYQDDLTPHLADLAYHFEQGEVPAKAARYLRLAGDDARSKYQNQQALAYYQRLLHYISPREQAEIYELQGDLLHNMGAYAQALQAYDQALRLGHEHPDPARLADIHRKIASIHVDKGAYTEAMRWLQRAEAHIAQPDSAPMARILLLQAGIAYRQGEIDRALTQCQKALEIAIRIHALPEQAHAHRLLGTIHTGAGDLNAAEQDYLASLELCRRLDDLRQESMAANSLAAVYYYQGKLDQAEGMYWQALELAEKIGYVDQQATVSNNLGELYLLQGRFAEAEERFHVCLETWQRTGFQLGVALTWRNLAQIAANQGQWQQAYEQLQKAIHILTQINSRGWVLAEAYRQLAEVELARNHPQQAWEHVQRALRIATEQKIKLVESNARRTLGRLLWHEGRWEEAEQAWMESLTIAQDLGLRYEEAKTLVELARLYQMKSDPSRAADALNQAQAIFQSLGARWDLAQVEAILESHQ